MSRLGTLWGATVRREFFSVIPDDCSWKSMLKGTILNSGSMDTFVYKWGTW